MLRLFGNMFYLALPAASSSSEFQGLTLAGWLMLIPGLTVGVVVLYLAATAPLWRKRHLHHW